MLVLQQIQFSCTSRHGSEIRLRVDSAPSSAAKAPWNPDKAAWRAAHRDMRKFANVAIRWIYRAANLDRRMVHKVGGIALQLFEEVLTDESVWINGVAYYHSENDKETLRSDVLFKVGARIMPSWSSANYPHRAKWWRLVTPAKETRQQDCAWGCGLRAIIALADRFADLERRHGHVIGSRRRLEHLTAHVIGGKLLEMWQRAEEHSKETK